MSGIIYIVIILLLIIFFFCYIRIINRESYEVETGETEKEANEFINNINDIRSSDIVKRYLSDMKLDNRVLAIEEYINTLKKEKENEIENKEIKKEKQKKKKEDKDTDVIVSEPEPENSDKNKSPKKKEPEIFK